MISFLECNYINGEYEKNILKQGCNVYRKGGRKVEEKIKIETGKEERTY